MKPYYDHAGITIYHGDCRDILPTIPAGSVDLVLADPPYGEHVHKKLWVANALNANGDKRTGSAFTELGFEPLTPELRRFVVLEMARLSFRWSLAFSDLEGIDGWRSAFQDAGLEYIRSMIWDKVDSAPQFTGDRPANGCEAIVSAHHHGKKQWNGGGRRNVFTVPVNGAWKGSKPHPSTKPLPLMRELASLFSDPGDLILDPFMGSGTTLVAAKQLGRLAIGIEVEQKYCDIAIQRLSQEVLPLEAPTPELVQTAYDWHNDARDSDAHRGSQ